MRIEHGDRLFPMKSCQAIVGQTLQSPSVRPRSKLKVWDPSSVAAVDAGMEEPIRGLRVLFVATKKEALRNKNAG